MKSEIFFLIALVFDFVAFVPQGVIGYIIDELKTKHITLIGILLMALSLVLLFLKVEPIINIIILSIGNAMIHIDGAEKTLRSSPGKMSPAAIFVSGGSFGLIIGKILASIKTPVILIIIINISHNSKLKEILECSFTYINQYISIYLYINGYCN